MEGGTGWGYQAEIDGVADQSYFDTTYGFDHKSSFYPQVKTVLWNLLGIGSVCDWDKTIFPKKRKI